MKFFIFLKQFYNHRIPLWVKNKYILTALFFFTWLVFIDDDNFIVQYKLSQQRRELKKRKERLQNQLNEVKNEIVAYKNDPSLLEKYARENYLMKKDNETIFIFYETKK